MKLTLYPCSEIVGFDKKHNVVMAESYWQAEYKFDFPGVWEIEHQKTATNPPKHFYIREEIKKAPFHFIQENPDIIPLDKLPKGVLGATITIELLGICEP